MKYFGIILVVLFFVWLIWFTYTRDKTINSKNCEDSAHIEIYPGDNKEWKCVNNEWKIVNK